MIDLTAEEIARFQSKITTGPECWVWDGEVNSKGYGRFILYRDRSRMRVRVLAHRLAFTLSSGSNPPVVRHRCDNPPCVRPDHLVGGTQADNIRDAIERGRLDTTGLAAWRTFIGQLPQQRVDADMKQCSKCREAKPLAEFGRNASSADGHQYWCTTCRGLSERERRRLKKTETTEQEEAA